MERDLVIERVRTVFKGAFNTGYIRRNKPRHSDAFVLYTKGEADYIFADQAVTVKAGDFLYLPKNGMYNIDVKQNSEYICIDFYFCPSDMQMHSFVSQKVGINIEGDFDRAFHNWMRNDVSRLPKAFAILYDIYGTILYTANGPYANSGSIFSKAVDIILQNYGDAAFSVKDLCAQLALSPAHVRRIFMENAQVPPVKYINYLRCEQAKNLLIASNLPIKVISEFIGFSDSLYFSRIFKKSVGISPSEYRKSKSTGVL
ncbi:MAG: helix-turn-helix transcriptional regulator [Ruminococcaceae bacterium]|nr:helix-turn-helix transcriptional regulator [Oscillospiraceae bacterium]